MIQGSTLPRAVCDYILRLHRFAVRSPFDRCSSNAVVITLADLDGRRRRDVIIPTGKRIDKLVTSRDREKERET